MQKWHLPGWQAPEDKLNWDKNMRQLGMTQARKVRGRNRQADILMANQI